MREIGILLLGMSIGFLISGLYEHFKYRGKIIMTPQELQEYVKKRIPEGDVIGSGMGDAKLSSGFENNAFGYGSPLEAETKGSNSALGFCPPLDEPNPNITTGVLDEHTLVEEWFKAHPEADHMILSNKNGSTYISRYPLK